MLTVCACMMCVSPDQMITRGTCSYTRVFQGRAEQSSCIGHVPSDIIIIIIIIAGSWRVGRGPSRPEDPWGTEAVFSSSDTLSTMTPTYEDSGENIINIINKNRNMSWADK